MDLVVVVPPVIKPCEPALGALVLARQVRAAGYRAVVVDANLGWYRWLLQPPRLARLLTAQESLLAPREVRAATQSLHRLRRSGWLLRDPAAYRSLAAHAEQAQALRQLLLLTARPYPDQVPAVADFTVTGRRPTCPDHLAAFADAPRTIIDEYVATDLIPQLQHLAPRAIGLSLTFLHQAFLAFRLAALLRQSFPNTPLWLGGALLEAWPAAAIGSFPGERFSAVLPWSAGGPQHLAVLLGQAAPLPEQPLIPDRRDLDPDAPYMAPRPIVPLAVSHGCYWHRCSFCPDHGRPWRAPLTAAEFVEHVADTVADIPGPHLHLTDNAIPPAHALALSRWIRRHRPDVTWHGFLRFEPTFRRDTVLADLAQGGCRLLEFGLESGAERMLARMHKGIRLETAGEILTGCRRHGIATYVYLLFGLPDETAADREATQRFVVARAADIGYLNLAVFNLPLASPLYRQPAEFGIRCLHPRADALSLYAGFTDAEGDSRAAARQFLARQFTRHPAVAHILRRTPACFKENHAPFIGRG